MKLILTHDHADFDAVAALVAAQKLYPGAISVLPRLINRNVRSFLTLHEAQLPLFHAEDLKRQRVRDIVIVDTRHAAAAKGVSTKAIAHIIDHHASDTSLPEGWTQTIEPVGATTTILVEMLSEREVALNAIEATLLLLGIYEDTGNLTYVPTSVRDVKAAAWLLEQGARLDSVHQFLSQALSTEQQELYGELLSQVEMVSIHEHTIAIAAGELSAGNMELSSIAHRLRDVIDPAALIMLVQVGKDVQLVARANSSFVNVGELADRLGGGGHARAAAGLVVDSTLAQVRALVLEMLPDFIQPDITVGQIMSHSVHALSVSLPVQEAALQLQKHGHEGYPVVDEGQVVGLLTRRAVDRALVHNIRDAPIADVMEAGVVTVSPNDSLELLHRRMIDHGWGQVPVVVAGNIVGIVTRTDLIKHTAEKGRDGQRNVAELLQAALPASHLALLQAISAAAAAEENPLYIVGGFVRDLMLGVPSQDFDLVVEGDAIAVARQIQRAHGGRVTSHARFGTAKWHLPDDLVASSGLETLDLASARTEFYSAPSALPEVERGSIKLDLHRRDFTINTLAISLQPNHFGLLLNYWGGLQDLERRLVRVLHSLSFVDDATRILRAVRLEQRLGFQIGVRTEQLITRALPFLERVSGDRIRREIEAIFDEQEPERGLGRLNSLGILGAIHPALALRGRNWLAEHFSSAREVCATDITLTRALLYFGLWLYRLDSEETRAVSRRLRVKARTLHVLQQVLKLREQEAEFAALEAPSQISTALDGFTDSALVIFALGTQDVRVYDYVWHYRAEWSNIRPKTTGNDLKERGLQSGPDYGRILTRLRSAWLDGEVTSAAEEVAFLETILSVPGN